MQLLWRGRGGWHVCPAAQVVRLVFFVVWRIGAVNEQQGRALGDVQVRVLLVGEVGLQGLDGGSLLGVGDGDEFVGVATSAGRQANDLAELGKLLPEN